MHTPVKCKLPSKHRSIPSSLEVFPHTLSQLGPVLTLSEVTVIFILSVRNFIYRHAMEKLQVQFQTTTIKQIQESESHEFFGFPVHINYVYIIL